MTHFPQNKIKMPISTIMPPDNAFEIQFILYSAVQDISLDLRQITLSLFSPKRKLESQIRPFIHVMCG